MAKYFVIIPCAGTGSRFAADTPKQYQPLLGKTLLDWTLAAFIEHPLIEKIILVANREDQLIDAYAASCPKLQIARVGGDCRAVSVLNGLAELACDDMDWVLVHDAARCCVRTADIQNLIDGLADSPVGGILATKAVDTVKLVSQQLIINASLNREQIYLAQTPQMFRSKVLRQALGAAAGPLITDEASAVEQLGLPVQIVQGGRHNFKVTFAADLALAELRLKSELDE